MISGLCVDDEPALPDIGALYPEKNGKFTIDTTESAHNAREKNRATSCDTGVSD